MERGKKEIRTFSEDITKSDCCCSRRRRRRRRHCSLVSTEEEEENACSSPKPGRFLSIPLIPSPKSCLTLLAAQYLTSSMQLSLHYTKGGGQLRGRDLFLTPRFRRRSTSLSVPTSFFFSLPSPGDDAGRLFWSLFRLCRSLCSFVSS